MSLADELIQANRNGPTTTEWVQQWVASLSSKDRKTWESWLKDSNVSSAALWRVIRAHGYPRKMSVFRHWVSEYRRDAIG